MNKPIQPNKAELRASIAHALADAHQHKHWTCNDVTCDEHRHTDSPINQIMALVDTHTKKQELRAVDEKLATLAEAVPLMDLCEADSDKILIWVKNHRWSLVAPPGKNTAGDAAALEGDGDE